MKIKLFIIPFLFIGNLFSQTIITDSSLVSGNWTLSGSPYIIQGRAIIPTGNILTIDPGVQVRFASDTSLNNPAIWRIDTNVVGSLQVDGKIIANGTIADTISFIADSNGYWGSVYLTTLADSTSSLSYCRFSKMNYLIWPSSFGGTTFGLELDQKANAFLTNDLFSDNIYSITTHVQNSKVFLDKCHFRNNIDVWELSPYASSGYFRPTYFSNTVYDNSPVNGLTMDFRNCIFKNNQDYALFILSGFSFSVCKMINCLSYNNHIAVYIEALSYFDAYNSIFLNNALCDSAYHGCCSQKIINNCVFDGNITFNNWSTTTLNYPNTNPNLVNPMPVNGDFHLQPSSICINAGDTTGISTLIPTVDLDGNPRYNGTIDIGPYEYQGTVSINQKVVNETLKIYPNPAVNIISLETEGISNYQSSTITIQNTFGQTIKKLSFKRDIDVSELPPGCYFLQITLGSKENYITKFIKQE